MQVGGFSSPFLRLHTYFVNDGGQEGGGAKQKKTGRDSHSIRGVESAQRLHTEHAVSSPHRCFIVITTISTPMSP